MNPGGHHEIRQTIRQVGSDSLVATPPGRVAVSRERLLAELRIRPEDSAALDEMLEEIGGDLLALDRNRSMSLSLGATPQLKEPPPPVLFYVVSESLLADPAGQG